LRRRPAVVAAAVTLACAMVLSLGAHLWIQGAATGIRLPWLIATKLPVLLNVLPVRLMVAAYLALAVMVAIFLDSVLEAAGRRRIAGLAVVAVALIPLIPTLPIQSSRLDIPAFFTDGSAQRLPATGSVLMTPYGKYFVDYPPELWEAMSGIAFKTQLGIVYTPGPGGNMVGPEMDPLGKELNAVGDLDKPAPSSLSPSVRAVYLADLRAHDVTTVIVGPSAGAAQVARLMTELLGSPGVSTGGVTVWYGVGAVTG
jgi:dolichyl-phosphate beta-glucosyltransferase